MKTFRDILASLPECRRAEIEAMRLVLREEIRAALAEHEAAKRERLMRAVTVGPNGAYGAGNSANSDLSLYGLNGTQNS